MKIVTNQCALVEVGLMEGTEIYFNLRRKWPFSDERCNEHICYALVMALRRLYEQEFTLEYPVVEFACFVKELLKSQINRGSKDKTLKEALFSDIPIAKEKKKKIVLKEETKKNPAQCIKTEIKIEKSEEK